MSNHCIVILGLSGSGKSTMAKILEQQGRLQGVFVRELHLIKKIKRFWESYYGWEYGDFDKAEVKLKKLSPTATCTVGDFQVLLFELFKEVDPQVSLYGFRDDLDSLYNSPITVITGVRSQHEAKAILEECAEVGATLKVILVTGRGNLLPSDKALTEVYSVFGNVEIYPNSGSIKDLTEYCATMIK